MADTNSEASVEGVQCPDTSPHSDVAEATNGNGDLATVGEGAEGHSAENNEEENIGNFGGEEASVDFEGSMMTQQPQLDCHLAVIEEQFRRGFDERFAASSVVSQRQIWEDPVETMRSNKIFREVSRGLGGDWRPIFDELMAPFPKEVTELEIGKISQSSPIIQGYKALTAWKEICGRSYSLMKLVDVLRNQNLDEIADAVIHIIDNEDATDGKEKPAKPIQRKKSDLSSHKNPAVLDNRKLLLIAKKIGGSYEVLAKELGLPEEEIADIKEAEGETYQGSFKVLWAWREAKKSNGAVADGENAPQSEVEVLKAALEKVNLKAVSDQIESL